jgi:hypothetical protein
MPQIATAYVSARVEPELAESFRLAAQLDHTTVSDALRRSMAAYVASVIAARRTDAPPRSERTPADRPRQRLPDRERD